jgi:hypothetical protein
MLTQKVLRYVCQTDEDLRAAYCKRRGRFWHKLAAVALNEDSPKTDNNFGGDLICAWCRRHQLLNALPDGQQSSSSEGSSDQSCLI